MYRVSGTTEPKLEQCNNVSSQADVAPMDTLTDQRLQSGMENNRHEAGLCSSLWKNLTRKDLKHFRKFVDSTTTHGLPRVFSGTSIIRRLFWLLLFVAAFAGCIYNISEQIIFLVGNPTSTLIEFDLVNQAEYPAITVCNNNIASRAKMQMLSLAEYFDCVAPYSTLGFEERFNLFRTCRMRHLDERQATTVTIKNVYSNAAQSAEDFIVDCTWPATSAGTPCSWRNFTEVVTNAGVCYQLNGRAFQPKLVARGTGRRFAVTLLLDVRQYDYLNLTTKAGVLVAVHPSLEPPQPLQRGISVPPGSSADISLEYTQFDFPEHKCGGNPDDLNFFDTYSVPHCTLDRQYSSAARMCRCIEPTSPKPKPDSVFRTLNYSDCLMSNYGCVLESLVNATEVAACQQDCRFEQYNPRVSYLNYPVSSNLPVLLPTLPPFTANDPAGNLLQVNIFFESFLLQKVVEEPSYDALRLLADIGGFLGLFVGVSVISVVECLVWLLDETKDRFLCFNLCKRKARASTQKSKPPRNNEVELAYTNPMST